MTHYKEIDRFLHQYGYDALKIIAAYEEAKDIPHSDGYTRWFGDLNMFEPAYRSDITCEKLCARYQEGLRLLGIIHEQSKAVCSRFLSHELAEYMQKESDLPITSEMETFELTKDDLAVDGDLQLDEETGREIICYLETWFDADKKFHTDTHADEDVWLNLYGRYNPYADSLRLECAIDKPDGSIYFEYTPTENEAKLIKDMITEKIRMEYDQTPQEFCEETCGMVMGGLT